MATKKEETESRIKKLEEAMESITSSLEMIMPLIDGLLKKSESISEKIISYFSNKKLITLVVFAALAGIITYMSWPI